MAYGIGLQTQPYLGYLGLVKRGGSAATVAEQRNVPFVTAQPMHPPNHTYPPTVTGSGYPSVFVQGMKTPMFVITACYKPFNPADTPDTGWCDAALFNSLLQLGTDSLTDKYAIGVTDNRAYTDFGVYGGLRIWDWARCELVHFQQDVFGGPLMVTMQFKARWGELRTNDTTIYGATNNITGEEYPSAPSFTTPSTIVNAGDLTSPCQTDFGKTIPTPARTLTDIYRWSLTLLRGQTFERDFDGTCNPKEISSKMISGVFEIHQNPNTSTLVDDTGTVNIRLATNKGPSTGAVNLAVKLKKDNYMLSHDVSSGMLVSTFSLFDAAAGGNPVVISALTP